MKVKKPIFIDLVDEDDEGNDDTIQQNERNNDQSTQQNERNNDSNKSALQMQVEELTRLLKTVTKGKQKVTDPKENIIDWFNMDLETQGPKSRKNQLSPSPSPSSSSSSSSTSSSPSSKSAPSLNSAPSSNSSSFLHYEEMNRDQRNALRVLQRKKVNNIILVVQKSINKKFFPVTDGVIKHVIHERHQHQREELLNARRGANWVENDKRRRHANS
ncbi:uncharacterized protein OCT59_004855 [Rhizophagus irregularis]|uniref:uncharacterized protein n=1 Tax=Rhizophagus irregularis TaxID=588596 RepID=UPI003326F4A5|nr:hypothetical protein OCT59_004855 [Rhizophagus irregularis]